MVCVLMMLLLHMMRTVLRRFVRVHTEQHVFPGASAVQMVDRVHNRCAVHCTNQQWQARTRMHLHGFQLYQN